MSNQIGACYVCLRYFVEVKRVYEEEKDMNECCVHKKTRSTSSTCT